MSLAKPLPWWVSCATLAVWEILGFDLDKWPACDRNRVLVAALDAEPRGELAVEDAVVICAKRILKERRRK